MGALAPGQVAVLTTPEPPGPPHDLPGGTGKTQLAAFAAESLWRARQVELLVWVTATSRASVLAGYAQAFAEMVGSGPAGGAETVAGRFLAWLGQTSQPWLVVLDDVADAAALDGLWPAGPAGQVLVTSPDASAPAGIGDPHIFPVGVFSSHEALTYLMGRLSTDPDQRVGAVDLLEDLGRDPIALAQASAAIASSGITCRDYRDLFARRREQIAGALGIQPAAKAVTWTLSVEQADQLAPGGMAQSCLALAVLLDGHGIPGAVPTGIRTAEKTRLNASNAFNSRTRPVAFRTNRFRLPPGGCAPVRAPMVVTDSSLVGFAFTTDKILGPARRLCRQSSPCR
jgi:hypothetical protein